MSDEELPPHLQEQGELDNPLRAIIVVNSADSPEGDMEEALLDSVQSFDDMNEFFDKFDEKIAIPNEDHIKYEVGSDGLVVIVVDSVSLRDKALKFMEDYSIKNEGKTSEDDENDQSAKKKKKSEA
ncbi:uncharacterized protein AC631_05162 [Debaryomyces fabryi]|uniref:DUF1892 domain-containing protein n=1 Tax=Debaryomyces fabryi TaxID=58627 RepID=A0A0V1PSV5_9ASCO|nr:uncharacterized protein AC631_05162 [Debaryomyces fabryi]KRZ99086.1 hypothetical protein AC631_05162 [Debaryomyces fabryi]CUM45229.1 unnamed protein product [Debaryomyces fabryi]